ncbi:MAG: hypothetical protein KKE71_02045, partial [Nanoarchaeota archaeon]|nr:hypothetical protein [Nanoarchaeota archaeon]
MIANYSAKTDYVNNATERALFLSTYNASYVQIGGDLSGTVTAPTVINTQGLNWGNLTSWNLGVAWTGSLGWENISGYSLAGDNITVSNNGGAYTITLPNPSATTKGGVVSLVCTGNDKIISIGTDGVPVCGSDIDTYNTTTEMVNAVNGTAINILGNAATVTNGLYTTTIFTGGNITGSWDNLQLEDNSVNSAKIIDSSIAAGDLASDLASLNKVSAGEITAATGMITVTNDLRVNKNLYIIGNITNVGVTTINVNGSAIPFFTDTFDIGSLTNTWRYGYFGTDVIVGGSSILKNTTSFDGNVTGAYNNLQLASGSVGTVQIIDGSINSTKLVADLGLGWANLTGYPNNCVAGEAIQSLGDGSFTCVALNSTSGNMSGAGTPNYVAKFTGTNTVGISSIYDNGTNVGIGTASPSAKLEINGGMRLNTTDSKSTCDAAQRGTFWLEQSGSGVDDYMYACMRNSTSGYNWVLVARAG